MKIMEFSALWCQGYSIETFYMVYIVYAVDDDSGFSSKVLRYGHMIEPAGRRANQPEVVPRRTSDYVSGPFFQL